MTDKEQELERLHDIVFEGAPEWAKWAAMDFNMGWMWNENKPSFEGVGWMSKTIFSLCKNQPETFLDWHDRLLERKQ